MRKEFLFPFGMYLMATRFTSMLISRFILNLRNLSFRRQYNSQLVDEDDDEDEDEESYNEPVVLSTVFGNYGAPLSQGSIPSEYNWTWSDSRENLLSDPLMSGLYDDNMSDITYRCVSISCYPITSRLIVSSQRGNGEVV